MLADLLSSQFLLPVVALLAVGAFVGLIAGLLGVGGGVVLVPSFAAVLDHAGYEGPDMMRICVATSLSTIFITSIRSTLAHHRKGAVEWSVLRSWGPWIMVGAVVGAVAVARLSTQEMKVVFGVLVPLLAAYMAFGRPEWRISDQLPTGRVRAALAFPVGLVGVLLGIGGGSLGVGFLTLYGRPVQRAVATASGFGAMIALPSVASFLFLPASNAPPLTVGSVSLPMLAITITMTLLTAPWGAVIAHRVNGLVLRRLFAAFLVVIALNMLRNALS